MIEDGRNKRENPLKIAYFRDAIEVPDLAYLNLQYYKKKNLLGNAGKIVELAQNTNKFTHLTEADIIDGLNIQMADETNIGLALNVEEIGSMYVFMKNHTYVEALTDIMENDFPEYEIDPDLSTVHRLNTLLDLKRITVEGIATEDEWMSAVIEAMKRSKHEEHHFYPFTLGKMTDDALNFRGSQDSPFNINVDINGSQKLKESYLKVANPSEQANFRRGLNSQYLNLQDIYNS